ncbi:MAG: formimidoylglutamate deiminase [bacterium]
MSEEFPPVYLEGDRIVVPGLATAHSHAFQRALRGRTQRRQTKAGSFWSWRALMYELASKLDPDDIFNFSRFAFTELAMSGVTAVGEFHYLHHQPDGTPYDDRLVMSEAIIGAAKEVGIRLTLIRTAYFRAGFKKQAEGAQKRFCDASTEETLADVSTLFTRYQDDEMVQLALAAHSIRAVSLEQLKELAQYAQEGGLPFHMHVAEQDREIKECKLEYGMRPIVLLGTNGLLSERFVAIHATHVNSGEMKALGDAKAMVCLCRTTERDLGDGLPESAEFIEAGIRLCVGVDSHASSDGFEEIRAIELDERSRTKARTVAAEGPELLKIATCNGYLAIGGSAAWEQDKIYLNAREPSMAGANDDLLTDAVIFGATPRAVDEVVVAGETIVKDGWHVHYADALTGYETSLRKLGLL